MSEGKSRTVRRDRRAFSLLELVMVVAIVGIVAAVAAPRYARSSARYRIDVAARRIAQDMALASRQARNAGASRTLRFNDAGTQYTISDLAGLQQAAAPYCVDLQAEPYCTRAGTVDFGGSSAVTFNAFGLPESGGEVVLTSGDLTRTIVLDANSGRATVQ